MCRCDFHGNHVAHCWNKLRRNCCNGHPSGPVDDVCGFNRSYRYLHREPMKITAQVPSCGLRRLGRRWCRRLARCGCKIQSQLLHRVVQTHTGLIDFELQIQQHLPLGVELDLFAGRPSIIQIHIGERNQGLSQQLISRNIFIPYFQA